MSAAFKAIGEPSIRSRILAVAGAAAIAGIATAGPFAGASEVENTACGDLQYSRAVLDRMEREGRAAVLADLEGDDATLWISILNQYPPRTYYPGDAVLAIVTDRTQGDVMVAIYNDGCELGIGAMPASVYLSIDEVAERRSPQA